MPTATWEISLTGLRFPAELPDRSANFRLVADLRYVTGRGEHATEHAVLPDLDRWWECDPGRSADPAFVRGRASGDGGVEMDMESIDDWDRLILLVRGDGIHSVQLKLFDVNRPDLLDRLRRGAGELAGTLFGRGRDLLPVATGIFADSLGSASSDLESALLARIAGAERLLYRGSARLREPGDYLVRGRGHAGEYEIRLALRTL